MWYILVYGLVLKLIILRLNYLGICEPCQNIINLLVIRNNTFLFFSEGYYHRI